MVARSRRSAVAAISTGLVVIAIVSFAATARGGAAVDTSAPVLVSLAMTPTTVDTSGGAAVITITARLTDETSPSIGGTPPPRPGLLTRPRGPQQPISYPPPAPR